VDRAMSGALAISCTDNRSLLDDIAGKILEKEVDRAAMILKNLLFLQAPAGGCSAAEGRPRLNQPLVDRLSLARVFKGTKRPRT